MLTVGAITLRGFCEKDLEPLARARQNMAVEIAAQSTLPFPIPLAKFRRRFEEASTAISSGRDGDIEFAVALSEDPLSPAIGVAGLYGVDSFNSIAEAGIVIGDSDYRGRKLGLHCLMALCEFSFRYANLNRVYALVKADNLSAKRICVQSGMSEEGILKEHRWKAGRYVDIVIFGILRRDWDFGRLAKKYNIPQPQVDHHR